MIINKRKEKIIMEKLNLWFIQLQNKINSKMKEEKGAVDLITIVVLIAVVMILVVIFRKRLEELINSLFDTIGGKVDEATN